MRSRRGIPAHNLKTTRSGKVKRRSLLWRWRRLLFLLGLLVVAAAAGATYVLSQVKLPGPPPPTLQTTFLCDASVAAGQCNASTALASLHGDEDRVYVSLDRVPEVMQQAVLAAEDRDFFAHGGVDPLGIARAAWADIRDKGSRQGGSTITQQYVKTVYLNRERTLSRKLKEAALAVKFEQEYSKREILERYLNTIYFGRGAYGIQAASRAYFGHDVEQLTVPEAALLAGIIRSPQTAEPFKHPTEARRRRGTVLAAMLEVGDITRAQYGEAEAWPFDIYHGLQFWSPSLGVDVRKGARRDQPGYAATQYFVEYVRKLMATRYGEDELYGGGLRIYTTLDLGMQQAAYDAVTSTLDRGEDPAGSVVAIDDQGQVKAMMGGADYDVSKVNLATGTVGGGSGRQPGSTFKAFALAEAIREGYSIESVFRSPSSIVLPKANGGEDWEVKGGCCGGSATLVQATQSSVNTVFAQLMVKLGPEKVIKTANDLGVSAELPPFPSIVLGSGEVSVLDMAAGYSTFANQGTRTTPRAVVRVERADGTVRDEYRPERTPVLTVDQAAKVTYCLRRVVQFGTGKAAQIGRDQAGKTGTTQNNHDAWFVGYTPKLTAAVWMGYPDNREMTDVHGLAVQGGNLPSEIWRRFMERVTFGVDTGTFGEPPPGLDDGQKINPGLTTRTPSRRTVPGSVPTSVVPSVSAPGSTSTPPSSASTAPRSTAPPSTAPPATAPAATAPPPSSASP